MLGLTSVDRVSASDPKSALALQRLVQAAVSIVIHTEDLTYLASATQECVKLISLCTDYLCF
jgi:tRNA threonylcarbamoyladenosine modification (KEOPS) complex  Pcc1 subunit